MARSLKHILLKDSNTFLKKRSLEKIYERKVNY